MKNLKILFVLIGLLCLTCKNANEAPTKNTFAITIENVENGKISVKLGENTFLSIMEKQLILRW